MKLISILLLFCLTNGATAQDEHCATGKTIQHFFQTDPQAAVKVRRTRNEIRNYLERSNSRSDADTIITVPVVVHVIHSGQVLDSGANISLIQIQSQIDVLNAAFNNRKETLDDTAIAHPQFRRLIANAGIKFCLAMFDTAGNSTTGITRDSFPYMSTQNFDQTVKPATQWDPTKYFNIWVVGLSGGVNGGGDVLGYSTMPFLGITSADGIVVDYHYFGAKPDNPYDSVPSGNVKILNHYNLGKTAVHEAGHWLGLFHTFGQTDENGNYENGCYGTTPESCDTAGDHICDTPPQFEAAYGSPNYAQNSCIEMPVDDSDMVEDYMDYVDDLYLVMFTPDQAAEMRATLNTVRSGIQYSAGAGSCKDTTTRIFDAVQTIVPEFNLSVYPNPSTGLITLAYSIDEKGEATILNTLGQPLFSHEMTEIGTNARLSFDLSALPGGLYFIKVQAQHSEKTLKFTLLR